MKEKQIKAFVVDDEFNVRKLLPILIDWTQEGYLFVGEASNGNEALDLIKDIKVDVIFIDINMPYMDGIELSALVREQYPLIKIVIITAYPEFEYAQRCIQIGVSDFLLKPLNKKTVLLLARDLKMRIEQERAHWSEFTLLKEELKVHVPYLREKFLNDLLVGYANPDQIESRYDFFLGENSLNFFNVAVIDIIYASELEEEMRLIVGLRCKEFIVNLMKDRKEIIVFQANGGQVALLNLNSDIDFEMLCEQCAIAIKERMDVTVSIGIGCSCETLEKIKYSYREALDALRLNLLTGGGQVISFGDDIGVCSTERDFQQNDIDEVLFYVRTGTSEKALQMLKGVFTTNTESAARASHISHTVAIHYVTLLFATISDAGVDIPKNDWKNGKIFRSILNENRSSEIINILLNLTEEVCDLLRKSRIKKKKRIIDEVKEYIDSSFRESTITLSSVSKKFYFNASYLSRLFKQEIGISFTDYLLKLRIEAAAKVLDETDKKAYQVADEVGFSDPYYFSYCFKKVTGSSIQDYRKGLS